MTNYLIRVPDNWIYHGLPGHEDERDVIDGWARIATGDPFDCTEASEVIAELPDDAKNIRVTWETESRLRGGPQPGT